MRFSIWPINQQPIEDVLAVCLHAEQRGWDGVWMSDHLMPSREPLATPVVECFTTLAAIAVVTQRIRVGSLVASNTFRHPAVVAKMAATISELSNGRFTLGIGAGWQVNEHSALGIELPAPAGRLEALDEACTIIRALLSGARVSYSGKYYNMVDAQQHPSAPVPLLVGAKGQRALEVVARHADIWNTWGRPELIAERSVTLDQHCSANGRDPSSIGRTAQALVVLTGGGGSSDLERWQQSALPILSGGPAQICDEMVEYQAAGVDEFVLPDFNLGVGAQRLDALDRIFEEVVTPLRG